MTEVRTKPHKTDEESIAGDQKLVETFDIDVCSHPPMNPIQQEWRSLWHKAEVKLLGRAEIR